MAVSPMVQQLRRQQQALDPIEGLQRQIENAGTRLNYVGMNPAQQDSRNPLERMFNLPEGQNALFDVFDVIGRPFQAISNVAESALDPRDVRGLGEAALEGLTGKRKAHGADILELMGVENNIAKGAGGFALDVLGDPLTWFGTPLASGAKRAVTATGTAAKRALPEPARNMIDAGRDRLQNIFDVEAPLRRTLDYDDPAMNVGDRLSNDMVDARRKALNQERFHTNDILERVEEAVKMAGGYDKGDEVARYMERLVGSESQSADFLKRVYPNDTPENIVQAAKVLEEANKNVLEMYAANGLDVKDMAGYMTHVITEDAEKHFKRAMGTGRSRLGGDPRVRTRRKYEGMTAEEANALFKKENKVDFNLFETNAFKATALGQRRMVNDIVRESLLKDVLSDPAFARKVTKDMEGLDLRGTNLVKLDLDNFPLVQLKDGRNVRMRTLGDSYVTSKAVKNMLDRYANSVSDQGLQDFWKGYDKLHSFWKKTALFSAGYHVRNAMGNVFNMWVSGIPLHRVILDTMTASTDLSKVNRLSRKRHRGEKLTAQEQKLLGEYDMFRQQGLREGSIMENEFMYNENNRVVDRLKGATSRNPVGRTGLKPSWNPIKTGNNLLEGSREFGLTVDEVMRFGMFRGALRRNKGLPTEAMAEEAAGKVREVLFDYGDITETERKLRRLIPFYTWSRKNIPFQLKSFAMDPGRYVRADKAVDAAYEMTGTEQEDMPEWMREAFAVPVWENKMMNLALPAGDLTQLSNIPEMFTGMMTPMVKTPIELGTNTNLFTGRDIKEFDGQTAEVLGGLDLPARIAHVVNQIGALRNMNTNVQKLKDGNALGIGNMVREVDPNKQELARLYEELDRLQGMMKLYQQETGKNVPTLRELDLQ